MILSDGEYMEPEPMDDLSFAYKHSVMSYQRAKIAKIEEERLAMLLDYISEVESLQEQATKQAQAKQMEEQMKMAAAQGIPSQPAGPSSPGAPAPVIPQNPIG